MAQLQDETQGMKFLPIYVGNILYFPVMLTDLIPLQSYNLLI